MCACSCMPEQVLKKSEFEQMFSENVVVCLKRYENGVNFAHEMNVRLQLYA